MSSGLSSTSFQSFRSAMATTAEKKTQNEDDFNIIHRKRVRTSSSSEASIREVRPTLPTFGTLINLNDESLKKVLINGKQKVRCPSCNALGTMSSVGKAGSTGFRRWKCGARSSETGCRKTCSQIIIFGCALGAGNPKSWASLAPKNLTRRINLLEVDNFEPVVRRNTLNGKCEQEHKVSEKKVDTNTENLLKNIENELQKELSTEKGVKLLSLLIKTVRGILASTATQETPVAVETRQDPKNPEATQKSVKAPQSYAKVAAKGRREWVRPTIKELEAPLEKEAKETLGWRALQWKPLKPINKRLIPPGNSLKEGPLKEKVDTTRFVYVKGMTRQRLGVARSALRAIGVDTKKIYDISFIGGQVASLLTSTDYAETVERVLTSGRSTLKILKDFDPLSGEHFRRTAQANQQNKTPIELYARRAAFAVCKSKSLLVATKYQQALTGEQFTAFKSELDKLMEAGNKPKRENKGKGKPKIHINTNSMEVDDAKKA